MQNIDINDLAHRAVKNPEILNYQDFLDRVKLMCTKRTVEIGKEKQCFNCPIHEFCGVAPSEYHQNMIFHTLLAIQDL